MSRRRFEPVAENVRAARRFVEDELRDSTDSELLQRLLLVVSELAANAALHACSEFDVEIHSDGLVR